MKSDNHSNKKKSIRELDVEYSAAKAVADAAVAQVTKADAQADKARAKAEGAIDEVIRVGEALMKRIKQEKADQNPRALLVKALGMLGSDQVGERASAALVVEKQRVKLRMTWDELIVRERDDEDEELDDEDPDDDLDNDEEET
jgi:hypothetical protein